MFLKQTARYKKAHTFEEESEEIEASELIESSEKRRRSSPGSGAVSSSVTTAVDSFFGALTFETCTISLAVWL